jgi:hypothetical protein
MEDAERLVVFADEWTKEEQRQERRLAKLTRDGTMQGRGPRQGPDDQGGSFYDWLGEDVAVRPEWGFGFDVAPDHEAGSVEQIRSARARIRRTFEPDASAFGGTPAAQASTEPDLTAACQRSSVSESRATW